MKCVLRAVVCAGVLFGALLSGSYLNGQTPPTNGIPFIAELTPPSLPPATGPGAGNFTLTILGANFPANAVVNLRGPGGLTVHPTSTTVNPSGSQIIAQFTNALSPSPGTYVVTVTNPSSVPPSSTSVSNSFYLPATPAAPSVVMNWNESDQLSGGPQGLVIADFSGNGFPGAAVVSQGTNVVSILSSNGEGSFIAGPTYPTGYDPTSVVTADFRGVGQLDLAITNSADNTITILFNNGGGTFSPGPTISLPGRYPHQLVAGDFNSDGHMDLAVVETCGIPVTNFCFPSAAPQAPGTVAILLGDGFGGFTVSDPSLTVGMVPYSIAEGDLNNDGILDLVVANSGDNTITILMGNGDGTFTPAGSSPHTGNGPNSIALGDFNGDGNLDLAVTNTTDGTVSILLNQNCSSVSLNLCTFAAAPSSPAVGARPVGITTGDINADGFLDLVVANYGGQSVSVLLGDGTGAFQRVSPDFSTDSGSQPRAVALGDFNLDGRLDVAVSDGFNGAFRVFRQAAVAQLVLTTNNPSPFYGLFVTFTAQISGLFGQPTPTGTMTFFDDGTPIATVPMNGYQGSTDYPYLNAGSHQVTAVYNGDSNFIAVTSNAVSETVTTAQTTITLNSNVSYLSYGQPITFSATIQPQNTSTATGTVAFFDVTSGSTKIGETVLANNVAQLTVSNLMTGDRRFIAAYQGDANFTGSTSTSYPVYITQAATTVSVTASANPINLGQPTTLTASVQPGPGNTAAGSVTFVDNGTTIGVATLSNNVARITVSSLSVGGHALSGQYSGDSTFSGSTSNYLLETVNPGSTTVTVTMNANPSVYGQNVTLTASVAPMLVTTTPTGSVTFLDGSTNLVIMPLVNGSAQYSTATLNAGAHGIVAKYSGDANFQAGTSQVVTQNVTQATTTTTLASNQNPSSFSQPVVLVATVQPASSGGAATGSVTFYDGANSLGSAVPINNTAQLSVAGLWVGAHSVTARYQGDANTSGSTSSAIAQIVNASATTTTVSANLNPTAYGQIVTLTATVNPAFGTLSNGQVSFFDGSTLLGNGTFAAGPAQAVTSSLAAGTHNITAQFVGNANFAASTSAPVAQTVNRAASQILVSSNANPSAFNQSITLNAVIQTTGNFTSANNGVVTFLDNGTSIGSVTLPGNTNSATLTTTALSTGGHPITVNYSGDSNFVAGSSAVFTQTVNPATTSAALALSSYATTYGQAVTMTSTVHGTSGGTPTGTIAFLDGTSVLSSVPVTNGTAQFTSAAFSVANHFITARYDGDANFATTTSGQQTLAVSQASTTVNASANISPATYGQTVTLTAAVQTGSSIIATGTVTFLDGSTTLGSTQISYGSAQLAVSSLNVGSHSITATYSGNANFAGSSSTTISESVNPASSSTNIGSAQNPSSYGQAVTFIATVQPGYGGTPAGTITFFDGSASLGAVTLSGGPAQLTVSNLVLHAHSITARYSGDSNFTASTSAALTQTVSPAATSTALVSSSANPSPYGQAVTFTAAVTPAFSGSPTGNVSFFDGSTSLGNANLSGGVATFSTSATALIAGSHAVTSKYNGDSNFVTSSSAAFGQTVAPAATSTTLASNANPSVSGQSVSFTAHVASAVSGSITGTVNFYLDGGNTPVSSIAVSGGSAQYTTNSLSPGTHSLVATLASSNANFAGSSSTPLPQTVTDFSISASPASLAVVRNTSGSYTLTLTSVSGLTGNVSLSCMGAPSSTSCSISPGQAALNGANSVQATVTIAVSKKAIVGSYTLTLKGTSGSLSHSIPVGLVIN